MSGTEANDRLTLIEQQVSDQRKLFSLFAPISDNQTIAMDAIDSVLRGNLSDRAWIKTNFSHLVEAAPTRAREVYRGSTKPLRQQPFNMLSSLVSNYSVTESSSTGDSNRVSELDKIYELDQLLVARIVRRRYRPGIVFKLILQELFNRLGYPFTFQPRIDGKPDFVFPSVEYYLENPPDAIVFTAKRSLRERWRQIVTEGARGLGFYLATIDEDVSEGAIAEMKSSRIHLVVPDRHKSAITRYSDGLNVISFEDFFLDHLDPKIAKWRRNGVIP